MNPEDKIEFTHRDRVMRAWQNSMEMVRDYQLYAKEMDDHPQVAKTFHEFAETEAQHAACLRDILRSFQNDAH